MTSFHHHRQGRRHRSKVRTRHYLDADICFVEVKLKSLRKVTIKKRQSHDIAAFDQLPVDALQFVSDCHSDHAGQVALNGYVPVIQMQYQRVTLVSKAGGERMTIDSALNFWGNDKRAKISPDMVVLETKSRFGRGKADSTLRSAGHHPIGSCSKYCIGLGALNLVPRINKFMPAYRRLLPDLTV